MTGGFLESLFSLEGRVAVVTGGSRGLGAAIAAGLARAGAIVIAAGRSAAADVSAPPVPGLAYRRCDVTRPAEFAALCGEAAETYRRLDILVNAAGVTRPSDGLQSLDLFDETIAANLRAAYACCRAVADHMGRSGGGSIVNVTSIGSVLGMPGNPGYGAAKGGLRVLSKALAIDLAPLGIRVNNLAPGYIRTAMTEASWADPERRAQRERHTMLGRWGTPDDLVGAAIFLASDASAYVTGLDLFVDGGWTAKGMI